MPGQSNNTEIVLAHDGNEYGAEVAPFDFEPNIIDHWWIDCWRSSTGPDQKRFWVHNFVKEAAMALNSGLLAAEEFASVFHEVLFIDIDSVKDLSPLDRAAAQAVYHRFEWQYQPTPGCSCIHCTLPALGTLTPGTTPDTSPERNLTPPAVSSPGEQPKRKRGRPAGSKDIKPRDRRGTQTSWSKAAKSRKSREGAKFRKAVEQQLQQQ